MRIPLTFLLLLSCITSFCQTEIGITSGEDSLFGTFIQVDNAKLAVLILPGSGPTDRNGNSYLGLKTDAYKLLAEALQENSIASLRIDKRGAGKSTMAALPESKLTVQSYVDDALLWLDTLSKLYSRVAIIGHSEGALIGTLAAQKKKTTGFISLLGAGLPADSVLKMQIARQDSAFYTESLPYFDSLSQGLKVKAPAKFDMLFRPSLQPYLISWFAFDPAKELAKLDVPTLIIGGTSDIQVPIEHAELLAIDNPQATVAIVENLTHTLKSAPANDKNKIIETYQNPDLPIHPALLSHIITFLITL